MGKVFICHASADKDRFVRRLEEGVRARGLDTWFDEKELLPGDSLIDKIFGEGIPNADAVIVVLSKHSIESKWAKRELNAAVKEQIEREMRLIPVILDGIEPPKTLGDTVWIRVRDLEHFGGELDRIAASIHGDTPNPVAAKPLHTSIPVHQLAGLDASDEILLAYCCRTILESEVGYPYISGMQLVSYAESIGLSAEIVGEAVHVLDNASLLKARLSLGSGDIPDIVEPTRYGMTLYLRAYHPNYDQAVRDVAARIVNHGEYNDWAICKATGLTPALVHHILKDFDSAGHIKVIGSIGGMHLMPHASLRRVLR